ncbi:MAG TPA: T9SS type A sorting domain-containing protein, partial [Pyrinomonadaceae bacterium]|nr:T9SS type A sorting domain-containing protein [Pyrinomonadaceae bacterium]
IPMHECTNLPLGHSYMIGKYHYWPDKLADAKEKTMELIVYPNPAKNEIHIESLIKGTLIEIFTADGKKVSVRTACGQKETISVDGWRRGTYVVKAKYEDQIYAQKIILH